MHMWDRIGQARDQDHTKDGGTLDHGQDLMKDTGDIQDQEEENQIGGQDPEIHWTRGQG